MRVPRITRAENRGQSAGSSTVIGNAEHPPYVVEERALQAALAPPDVAALAAEGSSDRSLSAAGHKSPPPPARRHNDSSRRDGSSQSPSQTRYRHQLPLIPSTEIPTLVKSSARRRSSTVRSTKSRIHCGESFIPKWLCHPERSEGSMRPYSRPQRRSELSRCT